ncbi:O-antigen ligase [Flavobacterium sp. NRK F7]|uniref:O-antigen ligase family protein n=1 Tax=Flavobacterium sp. NRK F7 TaxID=2954930 RepID=UPI002091D4B6|nr:O-antigen ligase family protein [Flavobacterium sp. NRK F7]MCO6161428.1 O-antigen ligase family protein [Flavobacterium sp. NRK F7]
MHPFEKPSGSNRLANAYSLFFILVLTFVISMLLVKTGIIGFVGCIGLIITVGIVYAIFNNPKLGILLLIILGFFVTGLARYVPLAWGLTIDGLLILIYVALFFKGFAYKIPWHKAKSPLTLVVSVWMGYILLEIGNPEAQSKEAWFYAMRGVALYQWLSIPLLFVLFNKEKDLNTFFIIWGILSVLGTLKGFQQFAFGVDPFEKRWLDQGGAETHILFGKLRVFSFYSDAGQFGASQGHAGVVFGILALFKKDNFKLKAFFIFVALAGFFGMLISGTRGAIAVPALGGIMLLILKKNLKVLILGAILGIGVYIFFAHTTIGQGNAEIRRMRTAFDPNEPSLMVRLENQKKLKGYLASRPFGGGVGATGNWGQRFTPHTFLANTATDSWYVMIWADTGQVGLTYYLLMLFFILGTGAYHVMYKLKDEWLKAQIAALTCGMAGIMMASYGNGVFGQMPTGILMYVGMVFMFISPKIDHWKQKTTIQLH